MRRMGRIERTLTVLNGEGAIVWKSMARFKVNFGQPVRAETFYGKAGDRGKLGHAG
jgi:hypothetical protein